MKCETKPIILKLGGSVVTDKTKPYTFIGSATKRIAREISRAKLEGLVIVHGGGSFGHPLAKEYDLASGFTRRDQLEGFVKTRQAMATLNKLIIDVLAGEGLKVVSIQPSAFVVTRNGRIAMFNGTVIRRMLSLGLIPVLYGDVVLDLEKGFTILSGDQIVSKLASVLNCEKIILACDVDGVYTADPKIDSSARLIPKLTSANLNKKVKVCGESKGTDVTGLMKGKLDEISQILNWNVEVVIVNGLKPERIYKALKGLNTVSTIISRK